MNPRDPHTLSLLSADLRHQRMRAKLHAALCGFPMTANEAEMAIGFIEEGITRELGRQRADEEMRRLNAGGAN